MSEHEKQPLDLERIQQRLAGERGKRYWRSLEELAETEEFQKFVEDEFPNRASLLQAMDRRQFLTLMGSGLALAGMTGCRYLPQDKIVPYVKPPEELVPGIPMEYASTMPFRGYGLGVVVRSNDGRPTKIDGNENHPATRRLAGAPNPKKDPTVRGGSNVFMQGTLLTMYDPDRSQTVQNLGDISTWDTFLSVARDQMNKLRPTQGAGIYFLTETVTSPTMVDLMQSLLRMYPQAKWHAYDPVAPVSAGAGARLAFGEEVNTVYHFDQADRIVSLDSDFLLNQPGSIVYAHDFIEKRRVRQSQTEMNRLYAVESTPTITGAMADHRLTMKASEVEAFASALAQQLGVNAGGTAPAAPAGVPADWIQALVKDLQEHKGSSLVVPGEYQSPAVHALAHAMNAALGAVGKTVTYTAPIEATPSDHIASLRSLTDDMQAGRVQMLFILGGNPALTAPADIKFADALAAVSNDKNKLTAHLSLYNGINDETSALCQWHLPEAHFLEAWGDARAYDGTASIVQPLIKPLYDGRAANELLAGLMEQGMNGYDIVHNYWMRQPQAGGASSGTTGANGAAAFEKTWQTWLHDGVIPNTALPNRTVAVKPGLLASAPAGVTSPGLEIIFRPDPHIWDGRYANNAWLQELPKPISKLVWDNAAIISPATSQRTGIVQDDVVELRSNGRKVEAPVYVLPGHPNDSVTVYLGYGRSRAGGTGNNIGFNAYALRTSDSPYLGANAEMQKTGGRYQLVYTHFHNAMEMEGRDPVIVRGIEDFKQKPEFDAETAEKVKIPPKDILYNKTADPEFSGGQYAWGMSIDLNACIGCNACTIGCVAENNIPVVGKDQVAIGREMHWIRVDRYYKGDLTNPEETVFQPVPCMHCETAPCEPVCPVAATTHSHEGLNQMIYNRCVGTRYCSNNCPYKVRRFNFFKYTAGQPHNAPGEYDHPVMKLMANPDVTVRGRGVMEKCSYCVQRINRARIEAKKADRRIGGDDVQTACQQACPTSAIIFGDKANPDSKVSQLKAEPHDYSLLGDLNTRPRTTYMARFRNPNPEIRSAAPAGSAGEGA